MNVDKQAVQEASRIGAEPLKRHARLLEEKDLDVARGHIRNRRDLDQPGVGDGRDVRFRRLPILGIEPEVRLDRHRLSSIPGASAG